MPRNKALGIERLYDRIYKKILLVESYSRYENLSDIIRLCRLKPSIMLKSKRLPTNYKLDNKWFDEFGNSLNISEDKKVSIILDDLSIDRKRIICTDLYHNLPIYKIAKISKLLYVALGKDEDIFTDNIVFALLGIDNFLRTYYVYNNKINICSPLNLGLETLTLIVQNKNVQFFIEQKIEGFVMFPCQKQKGWLTVYPPHEMVMEIINRESGLINKILKGG